MSRILLKKWFVVILTLKLLCSFAAWFLPYIGIANIGFISMSWTLGLILPIIFMIIYIIIGLNRNKDLSEASDEQFADSCYYLGFIFTISSIIFTLFDLNNIDNKLTEIVIRFGAAMLCTVIGLAVRIYLIGFKSSDFNQQMQYSLSMATENYCLQIDKSVRKLEEMTANIQNSFDYMSNTLNKTVTDFTIVSKKNIDSQTAYIEDVQKSYTQSINGFIANTETLFANNQEVLKKYTALADMQIQGIHDRFEKLDNEINIISNNMQESYSNSINNFVENTETLFSSNQEVLKKYATLADTQVKGIYERFAKLESVIDNITNNMQQVDLLFSHYDQHINALSPKLSELFNNIQREFTSALAVVSTQLSNDSSKCIEKFNQLHDKFAALPALIQTHLNNQDINSIKHELSQIHYELIQVTENTEKKSWFGKSKTKVHER